MQARARTASMHGPGLGGFHKYIWSRDVQHVWTARCRRRRHQAEVHTAGGMQTQAHAAMQQAGIMPKLSAWVHRAGLMMQRANIIAVRLIRPCLQRPVALGILHSADRQAVGDHDQAGWPGGRDFRGLGILIRILPALRGLRIQQIGALALEHALLQQPVCAPGPSVSCVCQRLRVGSSPLQQDRSGLQLQG